MSGDVDSLGPRVTLVHYSLALQFCLVLWLTMCQQLSFSRARAKFSFFLFLVHAMGLNKSVRLTSKTTLQNSYFYERNVLPPQSLSGGGTTTGSRIIHQIVFQVIHALGKVGAHFPSVFDVHLNALWINPGTERKAVLRGSGGA